VAALPAGAGAGRGAAGAPGRRFVQEGAAAKQRGLALRVEEQIDRPASRVAAGAAVARARRRAARATDGSSLLHPKVIGGHGRVGRGVDRPTNARPAVAPPPPTAPPPAPPPPAGGATPAAAPPWGGAVVVWRVAHGQDGGVVVFGGAAKGRAPQAPPPGAAPVPAVARQGGIVVEGARGDD